MNGGIALPLLQVLQTRDGIRNGGGRLLEETLEAVLGLGLGAIVEKTLDAEGSLLVGNAFRVLVLPLFVVRLQVGICRNDGERILDALQEDVRKPCVSTVD